MVEDEMVSSHRHFTRGLLSLTAEIIERYSQILILSKTCNVFPSLQVTQVYLPFLHNFTSFLFIDETNFLYLTEFEFVVLCFL